jgi:phosphate:Na+ symporter
MADMIDGMLHDTRELIAGESLHRAEVVTAAGRSVDQLGESIRRYLADLGDDQSLQLRSEGARAQDILSAVINLEHVADILSNSFVEFSLRSIKRGKRFSPDEIEIVTAMHGELLDCLRLALAVFLQGDPGDAARLVSSKTKFREFEAAAMALSVRSLRTAAATNRLAESETAERVAEESGILLRSVRDLRRIHSHLASFAYPVLHRRTISPQMDSPGVIEERPRTHVSPKPAS